MENKSVRDLMTPLDDYAVVSEDATLYDAFIELDKSQAKLPPGRHPHRAVLVVDENNKIIGKLGHLGFLKALEPKYDDMGKLDGIERVGLSKDFVNSLMDNFGLWQSNMDAVKKRTKNIKIKSVFRSITENIDVDATITEAVHKFVMYQMLSIPVTEKGKVVGLLRLSDLYDEVKKAILEE